MLFLVSPSGTGTVTGVFLYSIYGPNSARCSSRNFSSPSNGNRDTALANNSLSFCTTSSRFGEDTWKSRGPGARYGPSLGTFRQINARAGSCGNGSCGNGSSTSPSNRDSASGTAFDFPATCLTVVKVLQRNSPPSKHIRHPACGIDGSMLEDQ